MSTVEKLPKMEVLYLKGREGKSYYYDVNAEIATAIDNYTAVLIPATSAAGERIVATADSTEELYVVTRNKKASTVDAYDANKQKIGAASDEEEAPFSGIMLLMWTCESETKEYHFLFADTKEEQYKNICFDSFGYEAVNIFNAFQHFLSVIFEGEGSVGMIEELKRISASDNVIAS